MDYRRLAQTIAKILASVEGVGKVHPARIFATNAEEIKTLYTVTTDTTGENILNGWTISRSGFSNEHIMTDQTHEKAHTFVIRGFFAVNAAANSETEFNLIIDRIADAFAPTSDLGEEIASAGPLFAREIDYTQFAGSFAHYCELEISVNELITY